MEFLLFLTPEGKTIIDFLISKKVKILENPPICKVHTQLFGTTNKKDLSICLTNIKNLISPVSFYVNETVYHEAVHIAQECKKTPLNINNITLSKNKLIDVNNSLKLTSNQYKYELEAYYLEDKPEEVISYLKKYCL